MSIENNDLKNDIQASESEKMIGTQKRIGIAKGLFEVPEEFSAWDKEIEEMFEK